MGTVLGLDFISVCMSLFLYISIPTLSSTAPPSFSVRQRGHGSWFVVTPLDMKFN